MIKELDFEDILQQGSHTTVTISKCCHYMHTSCLEEYREAEKKKSYHG
jgi:hypothetical protein